MSEPTTPAPADSATPPQDHADAHFKAYITVFAILCVCTLITFLTNMLVHPSSPAASTTIIMIVSVIKAFFVGLVFMHLMSDWGKVYFIIIPVAVMGVMMILVLLPDIVIAWH